MSTRWFMTPLAMVWLTVFLTGVVYAQQGWDFPDFSAMQVFQSQKADLTMKVHRSGSSVRVERSAAISTLYVPASSKVYSLTIYPDNSRTCVAMKPEQARMLPSPLELIQGRFEKRTPVGSEVVEGHTCKVEDVSVVGADGKTVESRVWEAEDLKGIPVK
ncbi:MAG TPA: hypothetical protein VN648_00780, partial [Candidatus Methylomirabilis sp.]|nr:hypothetical protein [Candidatus Methylomirabilis sp.]